MKLSFWFFVSACVYAREHPPMRHINNFPECTISVKSSKGLIDQKLLLGTVFCVTGTSQPFCKCLSIKWMKSARSESEWGTHLSSMVWGEIGIPPLFPYYFCEWKQLQGEGCLLYCWGLHVLSPKANSRSCWQMWTVFHQGNAFIAKCRYSVRVTVTSNILCGVWWKHTT